MMGLPSCLELLHDDHHRLSRHPRVDVQIVQVQGALDAIWPDHVLSRMQQAHQEMLHHHADVGAAVEGVVRFRRPV